MGLRENQSLNVAEVLAQTRLCVKRATIQEQNTANRLFTRWVAQNRLSSCGDSLAPTGRAFALANDVALHEFVSVISSGRFTVPDRHTVASLLPQLAKDSQRQTQRAFEESVAGGMMPHLMVDVWSCSGISVFAGILVSMHQWQRRQHLAMAVGCVKEEHSAEFVRQTVQYAPPPAGMCHPAQRPATGRVGQRWSKA